MSDHWQAVALSRDLKRRPKRVLFAGQPIVLFRDAAGRATALHDRCPHRFAALSEGRVRHGEIECPYHGWRFGADGRCTAIPGLMEDLPHYRTRRFAVCEVEGAIFVSEGTPDAAPYVHCLQGQDVITRRVTSATRSTLIDTAENILDATHTHFTHKGLLRGLSVKRYAVEVEVTGGPGWVEACYTGEDRAQGLISKLLEGERLRTIGRYRHPGIAELEYWGPKGIVLATTFHLRQADDDRVEGIGWLMGPKQGGFGYLKALAFKPMFRIALEQDRRVLSAAKRNAALPPAAKPIIGPLDFLRDDIARIEAGERPKATATPARYRIEL
ncbi:MAG: Rieske 2Fe-2S domain-containing protein [Pseudomonadota bacterium]|nr:Rieske 2Fe-2S domain-containing protein [Pseudomonadota bacterium]